jgi:aspartyl/asparaginyl beta-hydroxylase (cupin superfamily)
MTDRAFTFNYQIYNRNAWLNDTNVFMYEFINLSNSSVTINNQMTLKGGTLLTRFKEDIQTGEKTATQYVIKFLNEADPNNALLVITKIPVKL